MILNLMTHDIKFDACEKIFYLSGFEIILVIIEHFQLHNIWHEGVMLWKNN